MTRQQLAENMSAHELAVQWPAYYAYLDREREREKRKEEERARSRRFRK